VLKNLKDPIRHKKPTMPRKPNISDNPAELRRRAEVRLRDQQKGQRSKPGTQRLLHELEVHQIELEMQNAELQKTRDELEAALEKYTDLYDFAPVGYFSIDEAGVILEANLTGAALLGVERSRLVNRRLVLFLSPTSRPIFLAFLNKVFAEPKDQVCEALLLKENGGTFWASFRGTSAVSLTGTRKWCRVAFGDITTRKQAEEVHRRIEALADTNRGLNKEITRRQTVEKDLKKSEQRQSRLLEQSHQMQEQLRHLTRQLLLAQEEERKRISRELHDEITQILVGIGAGIALLYAPQSGKETRKLLAKKAAQLKDKAQDTIENAQEFISDRKADLAAVVHSGKEGGDHTKHKRS
jgi:PAS domain S-box-containing protein